MGAGGTALCGRALGAALCGGVAWLSTLALVCLVSPGAALASSEDRKSAIAYLNASYEYQRTVVTNLGASKAGLEALATSIGDECAGVIANAPHTEHATSPLSARQLGEEIRVVVQTSDLREELVAALADAFKAPNREVSLAFAAKIMTLSWRDAVLRRIADEEAQALRERFQRAVPNACADMKAWAASGYRTLSAGTKAFLREQDGDEQHLVVIKGTARAASQRTWANPLEREEERYDKPLFSKIEALERNFGAAQQDFEAAYRPLERKLGFLSATVEREGASAQPESTIFARRRTIAGGRYSVRLQRNVEEPVTPGHEHLCNMSVTILDSEGEPAGACLSSTHPAPRQSVNCNEGTLRISAVTLPAATQVRLRLSEGRQITSKVIRVPARLGGSVTDAGFYFQQVKGPTPIPLSLEELGAKDRVLKVLKLPRIVECKVHALKFLRNGIQPLAHGRLPIPGAPRFTIQGEAYRFLGSIHFALQVSVGDEGGGESLRSGKPKLFDFGIWQSCEPHPYTIVYGVLYGHEDAVYARTPKGRLRLRRATIPRHLHAHGGVLVYMALREAPSALIVRSSSGKTLLAQRLGNQPREVMEMCEGEAEGPGA